MIQVLLYPDALSLVGSMNAFEIYNDSETDVVFALRYREQSRTSFSIPIRRTMSTASR